jgi:hypothetical protein
MGAASTNPWLICLLPSTVYEYDTDLYHDLAFVLINVVSILQHSDILRRIYLHQDLNTHTISSHLLRQKYTISHLSCDGNLCCDRNSSFLHLHLRLPTNICLLERVEEVEC